MNEKWGDPDAQTEATGTQALRRASAILRAVAKAGPRGATLADTARSEGLPRSTVHRILRCLVDEGFLEFTPEGKRYQIGRLIFELGLTSGSNAVDFADWRDVVETVARRTGVTTYLMRRSGLEAVCVLKADGDSMFRFVPVDVGQRRLLGVGAGATALLASVESDQLERIIGAIEPGLKPYPRIDAESLREAVKLVRDTGFAISQGTVVDDGFGMALCVPANQSPSHLAISIAAHASTITESKVAAWKKILLSETQAGRTTEGGEHDKPGSAGRGFNS